MENDTISKVMQIDEKNRGYDYNDPYGYSCKCKDDYNHMHNKDYGCKCKNAVEELAFSAKALVAVIDKLNNCPFDCKLCDKIENAKDCYILDNIKDALRCILEDIADEHHKKPDFGFASQIDRLICLIDLLKRKLKAIDCQEFCPDDLKTFLLCLLVDILTKLISIISKPTVLFRFRCECKEVFDCLLCGWVEEITELEDLIGKLDFIIVSMLECTLCTPCTTVCHIPKPKKHFLDCDFKTFKKRNFTW